MVDLRHGDCLDLMKDIPDGSIDAIITDPPYGVNLRYKSHDDSEAGWYKMMDEFIPIARRIASVVIFPSCQIKRLGWYYKNHEPDWLICWYKGSTGHAAKIGFNDWEPHIVYGRVKGTWMHDYFKCSNNEKMGSHGHPCPKPLAWAEWLVGKSTKHGMTVLDPFMGSGTTGVACVNLGRNFIGIEKDATYFQIAKKRIEETKPQIKLAV